MTKKRQHTSGQSTKGVRLPDLEKLLALPCSEQMRVYQNAASQLDPHVRHRLKRKRRALFKIADIESYLAAIEAHWNEQRRLCQENPDYFVWPSTEAWLGDGSFTGLHLDPLGALKLFGYMVTVEEGLSEEERQARLDVVFRAVIPPFTSWTRLREWGEPKTPARLSKMANCLAAFARNGSRREAFWMAGPVAKWVDDLAYLRRKYYRDHFGFDWPTID